jgi:hypothetical protein
MKIRMHGVRRLLGFALFVAALGGFSSIAAAQQSYPSPEAAAQALVEAISTSDEPALAKVLGANWRRYIPTAGVDRDDVTDFLGAWAKSNKILRDGANSAHLAIGADDWTLPIPIVQRGGGWRFDARAGAEETRTRRIGRNELSAMQASLAYYDAQKEYATADRNGDGVLEYAQRIISTPGKRDGLYWAELPGEDESPLGPVFGDDKPGDDYHGYLFKVLKTQGPNAQGGAYDYRIKGRMTAGFALIAWPLRYGDTGVMTFTLNHQGKLFQKDLGPRTADIVRAMNRFDPDASWQEVQP